MFLQPGTISVQGSCGIQRSRWSHTLLLCFCHIHSVNLPTFHTTLRMCIESHTFHYRSLWLRYWMEEFVKHLVEKVRIIWSHFTRTEFSRACENMNTYSCNNSYFMPCVSFFLLLILDNSHSVWDREPMYMHNEYHASSDISPLTCTSSCIYCTTCQSNLQKILHDPFVPGFIPARLTIRWVRN